MSLRKLVINLTLKSRAGHSRQALRLLTYVQGQAGQKYKREYFYAIDHQGMLFLEDARIKNFTSCFKEHKFLEFFFRRVRVNDVGFYGDEFPYVSPCGVEMNYIKCDDVPIVFTQLEKDILYHNHAGKLLSVPFEPQSLWMVASNGRVYHKGPQRSGGVGLIASKLAIQLSKNFVFEADLPVAYIHNNQDVPFDGRTEAILNSVPHYEGTEG
ncbi:UPF0598 protein CG30010 [Galendromus occidentalis]|uniref:UPF0598 protein CG30010 n=1 Tax=Galendromus occidentalis TaxID=34638 RepID=A0AAJ6QUD2_9ACAR|nr:UPF0598 protein CG30010 [Galendromus occidentalis]